MILYTIGEVSKITGISIKSLRYYDKIGLVTPYLRRSNSKYRYYSIQQTNKLNLIHYMNSNLRIPLSKIRELSDQKELNKNGLLKIMLQQKNTLENEILEIQKIIQTLDKKISMFNDLSNISFNNLTIKEYTQRESIFMMTPITRDHEEMQDSMRKLVHSFPPTVPSQLYAHIITDMTDLNNNWYSNGVGIFCDNCKDMISAIIPEGTYLCMPISFSENTFEESITLFKKHLNDNKINTRNKLYLIINYYDGAISDVTEDFYMELQCKIEK